MMNPGNVYYLCFTAVILLRITALSALGQDKRPVTLDDLAAIREVSEPRISPDGEWVAYTVAAVDRAQDKKISHLWMTSWDGRESRQLTFSRDGEENPRWSPDGRWLAFVSSRGSEDEIAQLWLLNRSGGEAERITDFKGGVEEFAWSPDSKRLALIVADEDPNRHKGEKDKKTPKPMVIDRYQFKQDKAGYLLNLREHLYVFDLASRKSEILTPGNYYEAMPAWSADSSQIAFVSKRIPEFDRSSNYDLFTVEAKPGSPVRQLTTFAGADNDPDWQSAPAWSPDGKYIAYLQGKDPKLIYYGVHQLAIVPAEGGAAKVLTASLDRNVSRPHWAPDSRSIYFLLEEDRADGIARVSVQGGTVETMLSGRREVSDLDIGPGGRVAALVSTPDALPEVFAAEEKGFRQLTVQNRDLLLKLKLAATQEISCRSKDGTTVNGFMVLPPDFQQGRKYPAILRIHGGPVSQFTADFNFEWQYFAARGYVVVAANPRGSSGRGEAYSMAIYADWGNKDVQDVLTVVDYAVARGIVDPDRLGVGGWSYGGMLTNYTIASDTRFKAATSGASISDILAGYGTDQYVREYELELGPPWKNTDVWVKVSYPFLHADRIRTNVLFLCGSKDFNVPLLNSEQMYQALRSLGLETQLVIYPDQFHEISVPSYARDILERYVAWYDRFLMPGKAEAPPAAPSP
jgi:dipeptidyl aminopeptidase/acylaminoacyl peptidase